MQHDRSGRRVCVQAKRSARVARSQLPTVWRQWCKNIWPSVRDIHLHFFSASLYDEPRWREQMRSAPTSQTRPQCELTSDTRFSPPPPVKATHPATTRSLAWQIATPRSAQRRLHRISLWPPVVRCSGGVSARGGLESRSAPVDRPIAAQQSSRTGSRCEGIVLSQRGLLRVRR